jgi:hypothetical protein
VTLNTWDEQVSNKIQTPIVYMTNVLDSSTEQIPIDFSDRRRSISSWGWSGDHFGIWSCRFSADGNEVVAGGDGYIFGTFSLQRVHHILNKASLRPFGRTPECEDLGS